MKRIQNDPKDDRSLLQESHLQFLFSPFPIIVANSIPVLAASRAMTTQSTMITHLSWFGWQVGH